MTGFDLGDAAPDADELEPESESEQTNSSPEPEESKAEPTDSVTEPADDRPSEPEKVTDPADAGPAFPYSEVKQSPLYAREDTWSEFEYQLDVELTPKLREEGIRDDELREIHDIVLEIAIDNLDEFPERLKEKRRESR